MEDQEREKLRSPNYPAFGLSGAIERAQKLYEREGKAAITRLSVVKTWGYNSLNGRSLRALSAMRQYGLLEDTGNGALRLSQPALVILRAAPDSSERKAALMEAAKKPPVFAGLFDRYGDAIPSDGAMVSDLEINSPFSGEAARKLIAAFRDTLNLVGGASGHDTSDIGDDDGDKSDDDRSSPEDSPKKKETRMADAGRETFDVPIPIVSGGLAILRLPRTMSETDYTDFTKLLDTLIKGLKSALVVPTSPPEP